MKQKKPAENQEKFFELQMLEQQMNQIKSQLKMLQHHMEELNSTFESITNIVSTKKDNEVLVSLGAGVFMKAGASDTKAFLMNAGADVVVEKDGEDLLMIIKEQLTEIAAASEQLQKNYQAMAMQAQRLQMEFKDLSE